MLDMKNNVDIVQSLVPATRNANVNGAGVDIANFAEAMVVFDTGAITDGTHTPTVEESADNSTFTAVAAADLEGTLAAMTANAVQRVGYKGTKRYIRAQVNSSGVTGAAYSATVVRGTGRKMPLA